MIRPPAMPEPVRVERPVIEHETTIEIGDVRITASRKAWGPEWYAHAEVGPLGSRVAVVRCTMHESEALALAAAKAGILATYDAMTPAAAAIRAEEHERAEMAARSSGRPLPAEPGPTAEQLRERLLSLSDRAAQLVTRWELEASDDSETRAASAIAAEHAKELAALFTDPPPCVCTRDMDGTCHDCGAEVPS